MAAEQDSKHFFLTGKNGRFLVALIFVVLIGCLASALKPSSLITAARAAVGPSLQIGNYVLISKRKASQNEFDYTYQASATNTGTAAAFDVKAKADSLNPDQAQEPQPQVRQCHRRRIRPQQGHLHPAQAGKHRLQADRPDLAA